MNTNFMINKELVRDYFGHFDYDSALNRRYQLIFGKLASILSFDISAMKKDDETLFSELDNYCSENGFSLLQSIESADISGDGKPDVTNVYLYANRLKEVLLFFNGSVFCVAYNVQHQEYKEEFGEFFKSLCKEKIQKQDEKKHLYFLSSSKGNYCLRELDFPSQKNYDVSQYYNDDFKETAQRIEDFLKTDKSGLIILHGRQGTGKTSFIRHLIDSTDKKFIYVPAEIFPGLFSSPEYSFDLMSNCLKDSVLVIEDCDKLLEDRKNNYGTISKGLSTILNLTDGLLGDVLHSKIICIFDNPLTQIDKSLLRKGRLVEKYEFKNLSEEKTRNLITSLYSQTPENTTEMTLAEIFNFDTENHGFHVSAKPKVGFN
ncbi:MAG: AAA family ATPase [Bacteroidales bacterium]|nr:AAA family ATPase [Bacteroidales bacterium]